MRFSCGLVHFEFPVWWRVNAISERCERMRGGGELAPCRRFLNRRIGGEKSLGGRNSVISVELSTWEEAWKSRGPSQGFGQSGGQFVLELCCMAEFRDFERNFGKLVSHGSISVCVVVVCIHF